MLESPATDPGRAAEEMREVRYLRAVIDTLRQELVTERKLVKGFEADLIAARKERDEALKLRKEDRAWYEMTVSVVEEQRENYRAEAAQLRARLHEAEKRREGSGRDPGGSGSQVSPEAPSDLRPEDFDPSRGSARSFLIKHRIRNEWFRYPSRGVTPLIADAYRYTFEGAKNARKKWANARNWRIVPAPEALGIKARRAETLGSACESPAPIGVMPDPLTPAPEANQEAGDGR